MGNSIIIMPPSQEVMNNPAALCDYMSRGPAKAYIIVLIGYVIASFAAGFIVTKMSRRESPGLTLPIIVAAILELGMIANILMLPCQPVWFIVIGLIIFLPLTLVGHRFAAGRF
jgi:hypothetical protein